MFYFEQFATWIWRLPFAVYMNFKLSNFELHFRETNDSDTRLKDLEKNSIKTPNLGLQN